MLLSRTSAYAVRAAIHLASRDGEEAEEEFVRVSELAGALDVPQNYLSKILHQLVGAGLLASGRGPRGGFRLARAPEAITLADLVEAVEPGRAQRRCLLGRPECTDSHPCPLHERWLRLGDDIDHFLHETSLADLLPR
jgi:Rrf2 family iron-sulfur cluster assembly transcriptional regulator